MKVLVATENLRTRLLPYLVLIAIPIIFAALLAGKLAHPLEVNLDAAGYLQMGQMVLHGARPYVDFEELNPPLILYLSAIPAWLTQITNLHLIVSFHLLVTALVVACCFLSVTILWNALKDPRLSGQAVTIIIAMMIVNVCLGEEYGQREHLFTSLFVPFFCVRWLRWQGLSTNKIIAVLVGLGAGLGVSIKPFFLLLPVAVEACWLLRYRKWRLLFQPETFGAAGVCAAYALSLCFLPADMAHAYFHETLPAMQLGYQAFSLPFTSLASMKYYPALRDATSLSILYAVFLWRQNNLIIPSILLVVAGYASYLAQGKGFPYHTIPMAFGVYLLAASEVLVIFQKIFTLIAKKIKKDNSDYLVTASFCAVIVGAILASAFFLLRDINAFAYGLSVCQDENGGCPALKQEIQKLVEQDRTVAQIVQFSKPGDRILFVNTGGYPANPRLTQLGRLYGAKHGFMTFACLEYAKREPSHAHELVALNQKEDQLLAHILDDVKEAPPALIFLKQTLYQGLPPGVSFPKLLDEHHFLEKLLKGYSQVDTSPNFIVYRHD